MNKIIAFVRRMSGSLALSTVILFVTYFVFSRYFQDFLPLPLFIEAKRIYMNVLAIGFFALIPISWATKYPIIIRYALSTLAIPFCCVFLNISIRVPERILDSTEFNNHRYHVTVEGDFDQNFVTYRVYKCDVGDFKCQEVYSDSSSSIDSVDFIVDEKLNELHYIHHTTFETIMKYTDGYQPRQILASEEYEGFIYNVAIPPIDVYPIYGSSGEQYTYFLYRCSTSYKECQKLLFSYSDTGGDIWLIINEDTNELEMYNWQSDTGKVLIFSYGKSPKCYVEQCTYHGN